ncbi:hypothetical protein DFA_05777 [Cavenderia fasciculata]|uniref:type II protein arginine methyltransferase n=1 Tax=Cavenderia fasciculata TaxID=261658 RepID=F4PMJ6_CACFS|nr:uncharacterized protein DFA_05777 [Cavenderia fasciculata]EGG23643.1 hypothetical protein DFA_05777 [Cavenderia fasciculata]|eukprot:XP_004361494.1 hypothetical protein DFA_05777 [Cavenderia fasciculata]
MEVTADITSLQKELEEYKKKLSDALVENKNLSETLNKVESESSQLKVKYEELKKKGTTSTATSTTTTTSSPAAKTIKSTSTLNGASSPTPIKKVLPTTTSTSSTSTPDKKPITSATTTPKSSPLVSKQLTQAKTTTTSSPSTTPTKITSPSTVSKVSSPATKTTTTSSPTVKTTTTTTTTSSPKPVVAVPKPTVTTVKPTATKTTTTTTTTTTKTATKPTIAPAASAASTASATAATATSAVKPSASAVKPAAAKPASKLAAPVKPAATAAKPTPSTTTSKLSPSLSKEKIIKPAATTAVKKPAAAAPSKPSPTTASKPVATVPVVVAATPAAAAAVVVPTPVAVEQPTEVELLKTQTTSSTLVIEQVSDEEGDSILEDIRKADSSKEVVKENDLEEFMQELDQEMANAQLNSKSEEKKQEEEDIKIVQQEEQEEEEKINEIKQQQEQHTSLQDELLIDDLKTEQPKEEETVVNEFDDIKNDDIVLEDIQPQQQEVQIIETKEEPIVTEPKQEEIIFEEPKQQEEEIFDEFDDIKKEDLILEDVHHDDQIIEDDEEEIIIPTIDEKVEGPIVTEEPKQQEEEIFDEFDDIKKEDLILEDVHQDDQIIEDEEEIIIPTIDENVEEEILDDENIVGDESKNEFSFNQEEDLIIDDQVLETKEQQDNDFFESNIANNHIDTSLDDFSFDAPSEQHHQQPTTTNGNKDFDDIFGEQANNNTKPSNTLNTNDFDFDSFNVSKSTINIQSSSENIDTNTDNVKRMISFNLLKKGTNTILLNNHRVIVSTVSSSSSYSTTSSSSSKTQDTITSGRVNINPLLRSRLQQQPNVSSNNNNNTNNTNDSSAFQSKVQLMRDFIQDSLYNTKYGYFATKPVITSIAPTHFKQLNTLESKDQYIDYLQHIYKQHQHSWYTPVEIFQPYYSNAITRYIIEKYLEKNQDLSIPLRIYEIGAGSGTNALCMLNYLREHHKDLYEITEFTIIEISRLLATQQLERIKREHPHIKVQVYNSSIFNWTHKREDQECFIVMTEVIDNLPHDQIVLNGNGVFETIVQTHLSTMNHFDQQEQEGEKEGEETTIDNLKNKKNRKELVHFEQQQSVRDPIIKEYLNLFSDELGLDKDLLTQLNNRNSDQYQPVKSSLINNLKYFFQGDRNIFIPTVCMKLFQILSIHFPKHHLVLADFDFLPSLCKGENAPTVQEKLPIPTSANYQSPSSIQYETKEYPKITVPLGSCDIFFPTNWKELHKMYTKTNQQYRPEHFTASTVKSYKQGEFLKQYAKDDLAKTKISSFYNPLTDDYENTSILVS